MREHEIQEAEETVTERSEKNTSLAIPMITDEALDKLKKQASN